MFQIFYFLYYYIKADSLTQKNQPQFSNHSPLSVNGEISIADIGINASIVALGD